MPDPFAQWAVQPSGASPVPSGAPPAPSGSPDPFAQWTAPQGVDIGSPGPRGSSPAPALGTATGAAIDAARAAGLAVKPVINQAATAVANSPTAQRLLGRATGAIAGAAADASGIPGAGEVTGAVIGRELAPMVKTAAQYVADRTSSILPTVARDALGRFTKLAQPYFELGKLAYGTGMGAISAEGDVLSRLNDPTQLAALEQKIGQPNALAVQPSYLDQLKSWFSNAQAAQQAAPGETFSAIELRKMNQMVAQGVPQDVAARTILQLRGAQ